MHSFGLQILADNAVQAMRCTRHYGFAMKHIQHQPWVFTGNAFVLFHAQAVRPLRTPSSSGTNLSYDALLVVMAHVINLTHHGTVYHPPY